MLVGICTIAKNAGDWSLLNEQVLLLSKKHGQLKQATTKLVQVVMGFLDDTPNLETKLSVIETLRTVTEGKVGGAESFWREYILITGGRFSSRLRGLESHAYSPTSRRSKATSMRQRTFCANCRSRPSAR